MSRPTTFPLAWPLGWPRTDPDKRQYSRFTRHRNDISISFAIERLESELGRLGAVEPLLSSNLKLTMRGIPLSGQAEPADCGIAIYFRLNQHDRVLACDRFLSAAGNIAAIAAHVDALRRIERYGVGSVEQAFAGYTALPPPSQTNRPSWRGILGLHPTQIITAEEVHAVYRSSAKACIGNEERLKLLNIARDMALRELGF